MVVHISFFSILKALSYDSNLYFACSSPLKKWQIGVICVIGLRILPFFIVCDVSYSIVEMQHIFCSILENHRSVQQSFFHFLGQNERYPNRVYLIYDGIHYDPLAKENSNSSGEPLKTTFSVNDDSTLMEASSLATEAREVIFF